MLSMMNFCAYMSANDHVGQYTSSPSTRGQNFNIQGRWWHMRRGMQVYIYMKIKS